MYQYFIRVFRAITAYAFATLVKGPYKKKKKNASDFVARPRYKLRKRKNKLFFSFFCAFPFILIARAREMCVYEKYSTKTLIVRLFMIKTTRRTRLSINRTSRLASLTCRAFNPINLTFLKLFIKVSRLMLYSRITIKQFRFPIHKPHIYVCKTLRTRRWYWN